jgi:hypothetical protein
MKLMSSTLRELTVAVATVLGLTIPAAAANYPLELTNMRSGSVNQRESRAYPGLAYNIRAQVMGGLFPYEFSLSNAPDGMTIDQRGVISWPNPQGDATPTIKIRDQEGTVVTRTWTIAVSRTGFRFVDGINGRTAQASGCSSTCGAGTAENPWRTLHDVYLAGAGSDIVYFLNGTYTLASVPRSRGSGPWERVEFDGRRNPVMWLAYPGSTPIIDFATGPLIRLSGAPNSHDVYVDGFRTTNTRIIGFQVDGAATMRNLDMRDLLVGGDGSNASFIMTLGRNSQPVTFGAIQDSVFSGVGAGSCALKLYYADKLLIEDNVFHDMVEAIHLKKDVRRWTVRSNRFYDISQLAIGGNMHGDDSRASTAQGEILFNNVSAAGFALDLNQDGQALQIWVYRNTFIGRVQVRNTDASDGPFYLYQNVIVNNDSGMPAGSHIYHSLVSAAARVVLTDNLTGYPSANIVDARGSLTPAYAKSTGTHGHVRAGADVRAPRK